MRGSGEREEGQNVVGGPLLKLNAAGTVSWGAWHMVSAAPRAEETEERDDMEGNAIAFFGVALGLGLVVIGAGLGIGRLAAGAAEGIARQPSASDKITGAVNLPLFLLEGVAILAEVFALLIVLLKQ